MTTQQLEITNNTSSTLLFSVVEAADDDQLEARIRKVVPFALDEAMNDGSRRKPGGES